MELLAQRIVKEARTWVGTKWLHQGRLKHVGVDCLGLIFGVSSNAKTSISCSINESELIKSVAEQMQLPNNYKRRENGDDLIRFMQEHMDYVKKEDMAPGDVLALCDENLKDPNIPRHLVIVTEIKNGTTLIIHASQKGVVEHRMNDHWKRRIHSAWRVRENE